MLCQLICMSLQNANIVLKQPKTPSEFSCLLYNLASSTKQTELGISLDLGSIIFLYLNINFPWIWVMLTYSALLVFLASHFSIWLQLKHNEFKALLQHWPWAGHILPGLKFTWWGNPYWLCQPFLPQLAYLLRKLRDRGNAEATEEKVLIDIFEVLDWTFQHLLAMIIFKNQSIPPN